MGIRLSDNNRHDRSVPDPLSSFDELNSNASPPACVGWLSSDTYVRRQYTQILHAILRNIEAGKWTEPTPIQMQSIPALLRRRDVMGCAPTGSGKSGAFVIPSLILSALGEESFYGVAAAAAANSDVDNKGGKKGKKKKQKKGQGSKQSESASGEPDQTGHIRSLLLAPSRELASQLHREVERLGVGKPGGLRTALLSKNNAALISSNKAGGKKGLDVLVATPLRLVECIERGLKLGSVRLVVLDEADRLLDCTDGVLPDVAKGGIDVQQQRKSGSSHAKSFLEQIDSILASCPTTAIRGLFSATLGPAVRHLSESVLRNPVDVAVGRAAGVHVHSTAAGASTSPAANSDIDQSLMFVGKEEGKLLAIRQIVQKGFRPPAIIFLQSKDRAQALFSELLYDGVNVDVIHAGRSQAARDAAVAKFRKGETWILICTDLVARGVDFKAVNMVINYDLPTSGVTYVHRIGRTGRAGRKGTAITLFTEADFGSIRPIANVMKLSGCEVPEWILSLKKKGGRHGGAKERMKMEKNVPRRGGIDTTAGYDKIKKKRKKQSIDNSRRQKKLKQREGEY
mmetsp:Transcript_17324/g.37541  ORF Transcript_17324/g.37541 Transcript_17324/m.37541 type:complete len:570 (+) Transcript_17324:2758-4467(+)